MSTRSFRTVSIAAAVALVAGLVATVAPAAQAIEGESRAVAAPELNAYSPSWGPDARTLFFVREELDGTWTVQRQRVDRKDSVTVAHDDEMILDAQVSPDGTKVAYTQLDTVHGGRTILVATVATGAVHTFAPSDGLDYLEGFAWSGDSSELVFSASDGSAIGLFLGKVDGPGVRRLTVPGGFGINPALSPDGTMLAYQTTGPGDVQGRVNVVGVDGSGDHTVALGSGNPTWSPDSSRLAVATIGPQQIVTVAPDGTGAKTMRSSYSDTEPAWSPDGSYVAFARAINGHREIWVRSFGPAIPPVQTPPPASVSVDSGAIYTNSLAVSLRIVAPEGAKLVTIANDGGFGGSKTVQVAARIAWRLVSSGADRLPKTVYVRFDNGGPVYTDDIILDQTDPTIVSATIASSHDRAAARQAGSRVLRVKAKDNRSGVQRIQYNRRASATGAKTVRFGSRVAIGRWTTAYVRVSDGAGNWSRWRRAAAGR